MQSIFDAIAEWLKGLLVEGIMDNLGGLFSTVNDQVGEIAAQVGTTPAAWNAGVFSMIRQLSETVVLPVAGLVLTFVMTYELIQMLIDHNNLHNIDTWIFFRWIFKTFRHLFRYSPRVGLSEKNVSVRLTRMRQKMKDYLIEREVFI